MLLNMRYEQAENPHDHPRAIQSFRECVAQHSANPAESIHASTLVTFILDKDKKWADASEIRGTGVNLHPRVSSRSLGRKDQQQMTKQFFPGLASDAAAAAVQAEKSASDAVQILELGRGIIANLQIETRTDLTDLSEQCSQIANEFDQLRDQLDSTNLMPSNAAETTAQESYRHRTASLELDTTVDRIHQLPNLEKFLLPPTANELMVAAGPFHPVVLINISPIRCDVFLFQPHDINIESPPLT
ncbi:hypothetical protein K440DRAFT_643981 [Wilcoxina mikolae CBS 423.85]|nr:hypothetical protein K440DRAFT_643981 [Wilcoxina mikolae CBS 423.85]